MISFLFLNFNSLIELSMNLLLIITFKVLSLELNRLDLNLIPLQIDNPHSFRVNLIEPLDKRVRVFGAEAGIEGRGFVEKLDQLFDFLVGFVFLCYGWDLRLFFRG